MSKLTIKEMQEIAESKNGLCLSTEYINAKTKLLWKCGEGHEWEAIPDQIKRGSWCPYCLGKGKTIDDMKRVALKKGGDCVSQNYLGMHNKLNWKCSEGHIWKATPASVLHSDTWCPHCSRRILTIEDMKDIAQSRGGECLSTEYVDGEVKLKWRCNMGHEWMATPKLVKYKTWCPYCAGIVKLTIEEMQEIAKSRDGECLSKEYVNDRTKLKWRCSERHEWEATPDNIKRGKWCPVCGTGVSERICRKAFELIFNKKFPKRRPKWLVNPKTNTKMELDGFCQELNLAFEYQGIQHFRKNIKFFHKNMKYQEQLERDTLKKELCKKNNVVLFEIPYHIAYKDIPNYIINQCKEKKVDFPNLNLEVFDYKQYEGVYSPNNLERMKKKAEEREGECISTAYINDSTNLRWRCKEGHEWDATPSNVLRGTWCPYCLGRHQTINDMRAIAKLRGGECLSFKFIKNNIKLKWRCKKGHEWKANPNSIKRGSWCPYCIGRHKTIKDMQAIAKSLGGECLSQKYINAKTKLHWRCCEGHEWEAVPSNILKSKIWCPYCGGRIHTIEDMIKLAKSRNGECLSKEYLGSEKKLKWRCKEGHEWETTPAKIKVGSWCPICRGRKKITIEEMQNIAHNRGGKCLSTKYVNSSTKLRWQCKEGHEWEAKSSVIKRGSWCPHCSGRAKLTLEMMQEIAKSKDGECLSTIYTNSSTKLKWRCKEGHEWEAIPESIKMGTWCPFCAGLIKLTIEEMQDIAKSREGECLSTEYINAKTKLTWRCKEGHIWEATPDTVKPGTWCPYCYGNIKLTIEDMQEIAKSRGGECLSPKYFGNKVKLKWRCSNGHEWEATPSSVKNNHSWCPFCSRKKGN